MVKAGRTALAGPPGGRALAAAVGLMVDRLVGEPPAWAHPVAGFGKAMAAIERRLWRDDRLAGGAQAGLGVALGIGTGLILEGMGLLEGMGIGEGMGTGRRARRVDAVGMGATGLAAWVATAGRELGRAALGVSEALEMDDLALARSLLPALVGRDPTAMDAKEVIRAVVESVAENTVDAVIAPILWSAAAGAPGALGYRAANTLDAMIGHRNPRYCRYGWASARLDDVAGWVPARVTALLVALVRPAAAGSVWRAVREDAPTHPSPNAGVAEAAFAAALGLRLGGLNRYGDRVERRSALGNGRSPGVHDIAAAVNLSADVSSALAVILVPAAVAVRAAHRMGTCWLTAPAL